jgi:hypothetical protein
MGRERRDINPLHGNFERARCNYNRDLDAAAAGFVAACFKK